MSRVDQIREPSQRLTKNKPEGKIFRLGELFCGAGGLALGALKAQVRKGNTTYGMEHAWAVDYDQDSCDTYAHNLAPEKPETVICDDVRTLEVEKLSGIDAFSYGFPCNDFSIVGKTKGFNGSFGPLYIFGVKVINKFKPKFFIAENVGGVQSANGGRAFEKILYDLENSGNGYDITPHYYKFEEYGVPQTRHRVIIVGIDRKLGLTFRVPKPTTPLKHRTAREALEVPPIPENAFNNELTKQSKLVIERLMNTKPGENAWNANLPNHLKLNVKGARLSQIYKRLHPSKPSYTITGSGGGGTHVYHWDEPRALTNRERSRLQTFPDDFIFKGLKESVRKQIGMAVSPQMAEIIFMSVLKTFAGISYPYVQTSLRRQRTLF